MKNKRVIAIPKNTPVATTETEKKVIGYIKEYERKGYSDAKIRQALLKSGVSSETISTCMRIAHPKGPLYRNPWFWLGIGIPLIILLILLLIYLAPQVECSTDGDCPRGYDCVDSSCEKTEDIPVEDMEIVIDSCGDGVCDTDESCVPDCGCDTDLDCEEYMNSIYYGCSFNKCVKQGPAESSNTDGTSSDDSSSSSSSTTSTCDDSDCDAYVCDDSEDACYESCDTAGDNDECAEGYVCASDSTCSLDDDGNDIADVTQECMEDADCSSGTCDTSTGVCSDTCTDESTCEGYLCTDGSCLTSCDSTNDCADGYACGSDSTCSADDDGNDIADVDQECMEDADCSIGACDTNTGICTEEICNDYLDNDKDGLVDITGGCNAYESTDGEILDFQDSDIELICGCYADGAFVSYGTDLSCDSDSMYGCLILADGSFEEGVSCADIGDYYSADDSCVEEIPEAEVETEAVVCGDTLPLCADGLDNDADGYTDLDDAECSDWADDELGITSPASTDACSTDAECAVTESCEERACVEICPEGFFDSGSYSENEQGNYSHIDADGDGIPFCNDADEICHETDSGQDYYTAGVTTGQGSFTNTNVPYDYEDTCVLSSDDINQPVDASETLVEYYCDGFLGNYEVIDCTCENDACIESDCSDGIDEDSDGTTDCDDSDCADSDDCLPTCNDMKDNDADETIDHYGVCEVTGSSFISAAPALGTSFTSSTILSCEEVLGYDLPEEDDSSRSIAEACYMGCEIYYDTSSYIMYDDGCSTESDDWESVSIVGKGGSFSTLSIPDTVEYTFDDPRGILIELDWRPVKEIQVDSVLDDTIIWNAGIQPIDQDIVRGITVVENYIQNAPTTATYGGAIDILQVRGYTVQQTSEVLAYGGLDVIPLSLALHRTYLEHDHEIIQGLYAGGYSAYGIGIASVSMAGNTPSQLAVLGIPSSEITHVESFLEEDSVRTYVRTDLSAYTPKALVTLQMNSLLKPRGFAPEEEMETRSWNTFWRFMIDAYFAIHGQESLNYPAPALEDSPLDVFREYGK